MLAVLDPDLIGMRDRALLTLGWCGAFRRSELVALDAWLAAAGITSGPIFRAGEGLL
jgi:site-specific recombinase XerC